MVHNFQINWTYIPPHLIMIMSINLYYSVYISKFDKINYDALSEVLADFFFLQFEHRHRSRSKLTNSNQYLVIINYVTNSTNPIIQGSYMAAGKLTGWDVFTKKIANHRIHNVAYKKKKKKEVIMSITEVEKGCRLIK